MNRYVAFLRGINISGKNKIPMSQLKNEFEKLGFTDVKTLLNSGNVAFNYNGSSDIADIISVMVKNCFGFEIPVFVILQSELLCILEHAPEWWGNENKEIYDNLIFIIPPKTFKDVYIEIGEPCSEYETISEYNNAVFWSFSLKNYRKTNWWPKTASEPVSIFLTIRTANTVKKAAIM